AMKGAVASHDIDRMKILNADFKTAHEEAEKNRKDINGLMGNLLTGYKDIGIQLKSAEEFSAEELQFERDAQALVTSAQAALEHAHARVDAAPAGNHAGAHRRRGEPHR